MPVRGMKYAVCSEVLTPLPFEEACGLCAETGFSGIEIAPFTHVADLGGSARAVLKRMAAALRAHSLGCPGFHWILKAPRPLFLLDKDRPSRRRAWDRLQILADLCAETGGGFLVLGSGKERSFREMTRGEAESLFLEELSLLTPVLEKLGVLLLLEPLPRERTNFITTLKEARAVAEAARSPAVASIFDFHNCGDETQDWETLVAENRDIIRHVHLNDEEGRVPTRRDERYRAVFRRLAAAGYDGWISLETFGAEGSPREELTAAMSFLSAAEEGLHG